MRVHDGAGTESVQASDVVITLGCGDACRIFRGKRCEDWNSTPGRMASTPCVGSAPTSRGRVEALIGELLAAGA